MKGKTSIFAISIDPWHVPSRPHVWLLQQLPMDTWPVERPKAQDLSECFAHVQARTWLTALCATTSEHAAPGSPVAAAAAVTFRISCHASDARYHSSLPGTAPMYCIRYTHATAATAGLCFE